MFSEGLRHENAKRYNHFGAKLSHFVALVRVVQRCDADALTNQLLYSDDVSLVVRGFGGVPIPCGPSARKD
jgi:hypothetical protein